MPANLRKTLCGKHPPTLALIAFLFFLIIPAAKGQSTFGAITGAVTDPEGAAIVDANITVTNERTGTARVITTGNSGVYFISNLDDADLSLVKDFPLSERMRLQFRTTMTNVFNHPDFGLPAADIESPGTFGKSTTTYSPLLGQNARQIDFMLRLTF